MKLRYITAAILAILMLSFFGCVPEKDDGEESAAETTTLSATEDTSATTTTTKGGGAFGDIQEHGTLPSISFDEFT
ncbi:MAG: hypothetical protein IJV72_00205 [Clostridia bacterium]|nr:hypothetical protein [Clostridia bacterium]